MGVFYVNITSFSSLSTFLIRPLCLFSSLVRMTHSLEILEEVETIASDFRYFAEGTGIKEETGKAISDQFVYFLE